MCNNQQNETLFAKAEISQSNIEILLYNKKICLHMGETAQDSSNGHDNHKHKDKQVSGYSLKCAAGQLFAFATCVLAFNTKNRHKRHKRS